MFLWENVDSFLDGCSDDDNSESSQSNMEIFLTAVGDMGYSTVPFKTCSSQYGLPQRRARVFVLGVQSTWQAHDMSSEESWKAFTHRFSMSLRAMQLSPAPLEDCLLPEDSEYVSQELERRTLAQKKARAQSKSLGTVSWPEMHTEYCRKFFHKRDSTINVPPRVPV